MNAENADPDVVALYSKMGAMENIRPTAFPEGFHGKGYAVNYRYYSGMINLRMLELIILPAG